MVGAVLLSVIFGIVALVQIHRTRARGRGLAITGLALSGVWVALIVIGLSFAVMNAGGGEDRGPFGAFHIYPREGECFNLAPDETSGNVSIVDCDNLHDAEAIFVFDLPKGSWPGQQEVQRRGDAGCRERLKTKFQSSVPFKVAEPYVIYPRKLGWVAGDRSVVCAFASTGGKVTGHFTVLAAGRKAWDDLKPGACFNPGDSRELTVEVVACNRPHSAQLTHAFTLPAGRWPGTAAVEKKASDGCTTRWESLFARRPAPVRIREWYLHPTREYWNAGDRVVLCYVTAKSGKLRRSLMGS